MIYQYYAMDGTHFPTTCGSVDDTLEHVIRNKSFGLKSTPDGLLGVSLETGLVNVQVTKRKVQPMKFGKFLKKVGCTDEVCRELSGSLKSTLAQINGAKLQITTSAEEVFEVYQNGPNSCMQGMECVKVYSTEDVAVAYVKNEYGSIVARSVVCINEDIGLQYVEVYGFEALMVPLLKKAGFEKGTLYECTLARIENDSGEVMMPYLDCGTNVTLYDTHIEVVDYGDYGSQSTSGTLGQKCFGCEETFNGDDLTYSEHDNEDRCESCYEEVHVLIDGTNYHVDSDELGKDQNDNYIQIEEAFYSNHHGYYIHQDEASYSEYENGDYYHTNEVVEALTENGEETCLRESCEISNGRWVHLDELDSYEEQMTSDLAC